MKNTPLHPLYNLSQTMLKEKLTNRVVTYYNEGPSSVKTSGVRQLLVKQIDTVGFSKDSHRRYIQGMFQDLDDGGKVKPRTLHVAGITKVSGKLSTAWALAKSVF
jgi:hypothetical protein